MFKHKSESEVCRSDSVDKRCWKFVKTSENKSVVSLVDTNVVEDIAMVSGCWLLHCVVPNHLGPAEGNNPISDHSRYQARARSARARRACALRALGLLLADGAPTVGRGKTF